MNETVKLHTLLVFYFIRWHFKYVYALLSLNSFFACSIYTLYVSHVLIKSCDSHNGAKSEWITHKCHLYVQIAWHTEIRFYFIPTLHCWWPHIHLDCSDFAIHWVNPCIHNTTCSDFLLYILRVTFINLFYINKMEKLAFVNVHCALCVALFFCFLASFILKSWTNCNQYFMCTLIWAFVVHTCCLSLRNAFWHFVGVRHLAHFQHNSWLLNRFLN